jgi:hypothetical protein
LIDRDRQTIESEQAARPAENRCREDVHAQQTRIARSDWSGFIECDKWIKGGSEVGNSCWHARFLCRITKIFEIWLICQNVSLSAPSKAKFAIAIIESDTPAIRQQSLEKVAKCAGNATRYRRGP